MSINWGLQDPNAFALGYQQSSGIVDGVTNAFKQGAQDNALRAYAMNPNDPNALTGLAETNPQMALQVRQQQAAAQAEKEKRDTAVVAALARDAKDPASFDAAIDQVVAMGYPEAAELKGKFSPAVRSAIMAAGGIKDDTPSPTAFQREAEYFGIPKDEAAQLWKTKQGTINVNGVPHVFRPAPTAQPTEAPPEAVAELRADPNGAAEFDEVFGEGAAARILGGQSVAPAGNFPPIGGYPRY